MSDTTEPAVQLAWHHAYGLADAIAVADEIAAECPVTPRVWRRTADDPTRADQRVGAQPAFELILDLVGEGEAGVESVVSACASVVVRMAGPDGVVAGQAYRLLPETVGASLTMVLMLRRQPHLTRQQCHDTWLHEHAPLAMGIPGLDGYRQLHTHEAALGALSDMYDADGDFDGAAFDGAASIAFADLAAFAATMSRPEIATTAFEDEQRFVDHDRSALGLFELVYTGAADAPETEPGYGERQADYLTE